MDMVVVSDRAWLPKTKMGKKSVPNLLNPPLFNRIWRRGVTLDNNHPLISVTLTSGYPHKGVLINPFREFLSPAKFTIPQALSHKPHT